MTHDDQSNDLRNTADGDELTLADLEALREALGAEAYSAAPSDGGGGSPGTIMCPVFPWTF